MVTRWRHKFATQQSWQRTLWIIFFAQMASAVGFSIIFPFLPLYVESLGTNTSLSIEFWAGMVFSAQAITMMIASPIWGALADRYGRKMMVQRATFGGAVIILMMAFVRSAEELVLLRMIQGLITGTVSAANALVAASVPRDKTGYAMSIIQVALWSGVAIGPMVGGVLADTFGFRMPFMITGVMLFLAGILVWLGIQEDFTPETRTANRSKGFFEEWNHILHMPGVVQTYLVRFLSALSRSMLVPIMPLFVAMLLMDGFTSAYIIPITQFAGDLTATAGSGVSTMTGMIVGVASATATASAVYLGRLGDRIGHRQILIFCAFAAMASYMPQAFVTAAWQLLILQGLTGLAVGGIVAAPSALLARYTDPGEEGAVYGLDNSVVAAARAVAPLAGAGIAFWLGMRATYATMSLVFIVVALVSIFMLPKTDRVTQAQEEARLQAASIGNAKPEYQPSGD